MSGPPDSEQWRIHLRLRGGPPVDDPDIMRIARMDARGATRVCGNTPQQGVHACYGSCSISTVRPPIWLKKRGQMDRTPHDLGRCLAVFHQASVRGTTGRLSGMVVVDQFGLLEPSDELPQI